MKKIMTSLAFIAISINASAQTKDTFVLKTIPNYDEFGNLYTVSKSYNHVPTSKDSADFKIESDTQIKIWMDSIKKEIYKPVKRLKKKN